MPALRAKFAVIRTASALGIDDHARFNAIAEMCFPQSCRLLKKRFQRCCLNKVENILHDRFSKNVACPSYSEN